MSGISRTLKPGDAAMFAEGDCLHWNVPRYIRKFAVWGQPGRVVARYMLRKLRNEARRAADRMRSRPAERSNGRPGATIAVAQA